MIHYEWERIMIGEKMTTVLIARKNLSRLHERAWVVGFDVNYEYLVEIVCSWLGVPPRIFKGTSDG